MKSGETGKVSLRKPWLQDAPSALQERLMLALAEAGAPISSADLGKRVQLSTSAVKGYGAWLLKKEFVGQHRRSVRRVVGGRTCALPEVFWNLQPKGIEYLSCKKTAGVSEQTAV